MHKLLTRSVMSFALTAMATTTSIRVAGADTPDPASPTSQMFPTIEGTPGAKFIAIQLGMTALELKKVAIVLSFRNPAKTTANWYRKLEASLTEQINTLKGLQDSKQFDVEAQARSIRASLLTLEEQTELHAALAEYRHARSLMTLEDAEKFVEWAETGYGGFKPDMSRFAYYFDKGKLTSNFVKESGEKRRRQLEAVKRITAADIRLTKNLAALGEPRSVAFVYSAVGHEEQLRGRLANLSSFNSRYMSKLYLSRLEQKLQSKIAKRELMIGSLKVLEDPKFRQPLLIRAFSTALVALAAYDVGARFYVLAKGQNPGFFPGKRIFDATRHRIFHGKPKPEAPATTEPL